MQNNSQLPTKEEAKDLYDYPPRMSRKRKIPFSYDELQKFFDEGLTFQAIADLSGVSRQRIDQIYSKYFAPFNLDRKEKVAEVRRKRLEERANNHLKSIGKLSVLLKLAEKEGFEVKAISPRNDSFTSRSGIALVNGKICGVHYSKVKSKTTDHGYRFYYRIWTLKEVVKETEFTIILAGKKNPRIFVVPSKIILDLFPDDPTKDKKMIYIPAKFLPVYNNQYPEIDWYSYENAWSYLE